MALHFVLILDDKSRTCPRIIVFVLMICVAVPEDTIWPIEPHTSAKHQILRKYLDAWLPILGRHNSRIVYIDGFAGPGEYSGGEPGSPIIALEAAYAPRSVGW